MKREIITTLDGSTTIHLPEWDECYHSKHGAIQEAYHVFIQNGLYLSKEQSVSILEIGFGTGLNAFITFLESKKNNLAINYVGVEAFPVTMEEAFAMNYLKQLDANSLELEFKKMHESSWELPWLAYGVRREIQRIGTRCARRKYQLIVQEKALSGAGTYPNAARSLMPKLRRQRLIQHPLWRRAAGNERVQVL